MSSDIQLFADWFRSQSSRLHALPSDEVADEVWEQLALIDEQLGVEVERHGDQKGPRGIIFTAFSQPDAFPLVRAIVALLDPLEDWNVCALKPPRGFDFSLTLGRQELRASTLSFRPIPEIKNGFALLAPGLAVAGQGAEEAAWLIMETGVGEELAGRISHLEFGDPAQATDARPITEFADALVSPTGK